MHNAKLMSNKLNILTRRFNLVFVPGEPLFVGMDLTIASFDAISEVNMVSFVF